MWQYVLITISSSCFFTFVIMGVLKYGLLSCYSAYGPKWEEWYPKLNIWSIVTAITSALMIPVLLEQSFNSDWQSLGFLAPISLIAVAASPDYQTSTFANVMHQVGAWGGVVFVVLYTILIHSSVFWIFLPLLAIAIGLGFWKKGTLMFWAEMAMYLAMYIILYVII